MRNAMICVSMMLAVFLGWPLAFGSGGTPTLQQSRAEASAILAPVAAAEVKPVQVAAAAVPAKPESCYKRYQREIRQCTGGSGAACRLGAADHWDMCEATGFWPE